MQRSLGQGIVQWRHHHHQEPAEPYVPSFRIADQDEDGMNSAEEFEKACALGLVISPYDTIPNDTQGGK